MRYILFLTGLLLAGLLQAQEVVRYVVPGGAGTKTGVSWANAMGDVEKALKVPGVTAVRVSWGTYPVRNELFVPANTVLSGGWTTDGQRIPEGALQTVLQSSGMGRVATVAGIIENFTVTGGSVSGKDGGGLWVKGTGQVVNCVVKGNSAGYFFPRIGDALCADGSFLHREDINASNRNKVCGIVFWVNPDREAAPGARGWAVALESKPTDADDTKNQWGKAGASTQYVTGKSCATIMEALADTNGWGHTRAMRNTAGGMPDNCLAAKYCWEYRANLGESWYLPSVGQLNKLFSEWREVTKTYQAYDADAMTNNYVWPYENAPFYSSSEFLDDPEQVWMFVTYYGENGPRLVKKYDTAIGVETLPVTSF